MTVRVHQLTVHMHQQLTVHVYHGPTAGMHSRMPTTQLIGLS
jgi:hypothetical protein